MIEWFPLGFVKAWLKSSSNKGFLAPWCVQKACFFTLKIGLPVLAGLSLKLKSSQNWQIYRMISGQNGKNRPWNNYNLKSKEIIKSLKRNTAKNHIKSGFQQEGCIFGKTKMLSLYRIGLGVNGEECKVKFCKCSNTHEIRFWA